MSGRYRTVNLSSDPIVAKAIEDKIEGWHAHKHKRPFDPSQSDSWQDGYHKSKRGCSLSPHEIRWIIQG